MSLDRAKEIMGTLRADTPISEAKAKIVNGMCQTLRHDFGLNKPEGACKLSSGMTDDERQYLTDQMAQLYDHHVAPHITENEKLLKLLTRMVDQHVPLTELEGVPGWSRVVELVDVTAQRDTLKAEIERQAAQFKEWQASHHANYVAMADERDELKAECEGLRAALTDSREFIMHEAKVNCMLVGNGEVSHMFPRRKALVAQVDAALGKGEQA